MKITDRLPILTTGTQPQAVLALRSGYALEILWSGADLILVQGFRVELYFGFQFSTCAI